MASDEKPKRVTPIRTRGFGTGLTRHMREEFDPSPHAAQAEPESELAAEVGDLFRRAYPSPVERIHDMERWAVETLRRLSLPDRPGYVSVEGAAGWSWLEPESFVPPIKPENDRGWMSAMAFAKRGDESLAWFAATALELIAEIRGAFRANNGLAAVELGWQLGALGERCWWKFNHEAAAEAGYRLRDGRARGARAGSTGAKKKGDRNRQAVIEATKLLWKEKPSLIGKFKQSASTLASRSGKYFSGLQTAPLSPDTMRKIISEEKKAGKL